MKYIEWRDELESYLTDLSEDERKKVLSYYAEMYADRRDAGLTEEEAVSEFGPPYDAAKKVKEDAEGDERAQAEHRSTGTFEASGPVDSLEIAGALGKVFVHFYDGDKVTAQYPEDGLLDYKVKEAGGKVIITHKNVKFRDLRAVKKVMADLNVFIPKESVPDCRIELSAGNLTLGGGTYGNLQITVEGGALTAGRLTCSDAKIINDAGAVKIESVICHRLSVEANAGSLSVGEICGSTAELKINAGKADIRGVDCKRVEAAVSMGKLDLRLCGAREDYDADVKRILSGCNIEPSADGRERSIKAEVSLGRMSVSFER